MPAKKYHVALTTQQQHKVEVVARSYKHSARERTRAQILLLADSNHADGSLSDEAICQQTHVCRLTVERVRKRFAQGGLQAALERKEQHNRKPRTFDGEGEAFLVATVCSAPPDGQKRWSLHLLQDKVIQAGYTDYVSRETIRQTLKKMRSNPG